MMSGNVSQCLKHLSGGGSFVSQKLPGYSFKNKNGTLNVTNRLHPNKIDLTAFISCAVILTAETLLWVLHAGNY